MKFCSGATKFIYTVQQAMQSTCISGYRTIKSFLTRQALITWLTGVAELDIFMRLNNNRGSGIPPSIAGPQENFVNFNKQYTNFKEL